MSEYESKVVLTKYFHQVLDPVENFLPNCQPGYLKIGTSGTVYSERIRQAEGFLRLFWGYAGYYKHHPVDETFKVLLKGVKAGTNKTSENYWGDITDVNQLMVEMAPLAVFYLMNKQACLNEMTLDEQNNLVQWLDQINYHETAHNNWIFFRVMVNVCLRDCFNQDNQAQIEKDLATIDTFYLGNGWYFDGVKQQRDYYISFAIHYYSLLYAYFCKTSDSVNATKFRNRALEFAQTFRYWFDAKGRGIPFGRSLTYRFAQSAFWSAFLLTVDEADSEMKSEAKYNLFQNIAQWLDKDIFSTDGFLKVGYFYENLVMAEEYNGPGSPYWALKSFILLATDDEKVWGIKESQQPKDETKILPEAQMLMQTLENNQQVQAFPVGQFVEKHSQGEAKYSKFVYSTEFGFSVAKGNRGWDNGGYDNVLAVSEEDDFFRICTQTAEFAVHENYTYRKWEPWADVTIKSFVIPMMGNHFRIHQINSARPLTIRDGGFAVPYDDNLVEIKTTDNNFSLVSQGLLSTVVSMDAQMIGGISNRWVNQNVYYPCVETPYLTATVKPGSNVFCNYFVGKSGDTLGNELPVFVSVTDGEFIFNIKGEDTRIKLKEWKN